MKLVYTAEATHISHLTNAHCSQLLVVNLFKNKLPSRYVQLVIDCFTFYNTSSADITVPKQRASYNEVCFCLNVTGARLSQAVE